MEKKKYVLYGLAGYVANKHLKAIKDTGGELIAATDPHDSVGIVDSFFPDCEFFTNESEFRLFCKDNKIDYTVICSPNYLHKSQAEFGLNFSNIICEKPVVLHPSDLENLVDTELRTGHRVFTILQLRLNPMLQGLKCEIEQADKYYDAQVSYVTPRGKWYHSAWKGNENLSGGIQTNIGIHLFDILIFLFGKVKDIKLKTKTPTEVSGELFLERGHTAFHLSIDGVKPERTLKIGTREIEFSRGFTGAHVRSYDKILRGKGFGLVDALPSIILCNQIRNMVVN